MPKKKVNGFFLFMRDYVAKENKKGRNLSVSMQQTQSEAGNIWSNMKEHEKAVYNKRAKGENSNPTQEVVKYTSQGVPLSLIEKEKKNKDNEERLMKKEIEDTVKTNFLNGIKSLSQHKYYFIMINYFAKDNEGSIYLPAEIGLSEYSLEDGITNKFHSFVNPAVEMFGYAYTAKVHSEATHKLPLPPNALGEKNLSRLYSEILKFIQAGSDLDDDDNNLHSRKSYPPVYTHKESVPIVKAALNYLLNDGSDYPELKIYPIHYLFFTLKKATSEIGECKKPESIHITDAILDRDQHEYARDISCDFHEKNDTGKYCALSSVIRWGYMFSEYMCNDLAISMIPGRHIPEGTIQRPLTNMGSLTFGSSKASRYDFDDDEDEMDFKTSTEETFNYSKIHDSTSRIEPKLERQHWSRSDFSIVSEDDFPSLGGGASSSYNVKRGGNIEISDADTKKPKKIEQSGENPWATRNKVNAKPPNEDSFNFSNILTGSGRGVKTDNNLNTAPSTSIRSRGIGRGHYFMDQ